MIWNPWKEIKRLREELNVAKYYIRMATAEETSLRELWSMADQRLSAVRNVLDQIGLEEARTSTAAVKRICNMAREGLKI